jgi:hypothetical protein
MYIYYRDLYDQFIYIYFYFVTNIFVNFIKNLLKKHIGFVNKFTTTQTSDKFPKSNIKLAASYRYDPFSH